jgi:hypothetical protein
MYPISASKCHKNASRVHQTSIIEHLKKIISDFLSFGGFIELA